MSQKQSNNEISCIVWEIKQRCISTSKNAVQMFLPHIFFFFSRRYNPWWVLACFTILFHNLLSLYFSLQFLTFIFFRSSSTWSSHLSLGLPISSPHTQVKFKKKKNLNFHFLLLTFLFWVSNLRTNVRL